jgi:hypothetical protein
MHIVGGGHFSCQREGVKLPLDVATALTLTLDGDVAIFTIPMVLSPAQWSAVAMLAAGTHGRASACAVDGTSVASGPWLADGALRTDGTWAMVGLLECTAEGRCRPP